MAGLNRSSSNPMRNLLPPQELLDDLCSRFVLNVPKEDLESFERILFLLEQAHWFYEDNAVEQNPSLKSLSFKEFTSLMFNSCAALRPYIAHIDDIYKDFTSYKFRVPVTGAIILDETYERCLLVKGWKAGASWSFPRGKKSKDEEDHTCAVREEISWHRLDELQPAGDDAISRGVNGLKLYMVAPFLIALKAWIASHPPPTCQKSDASARGTCVWKAKNNSGGPMTTENPLIRVGSESHNADTAPGKSFRNFRFDTDSIIQSIKAAFSTN
ncbi:mRNA-decapping enzyme subunit 2 isoform X2 [Elaeis guineensis]|uniref:mRNA-decapping enzyme subunit 2 isoform X3 n=1 Tax=Elaeis guineensis var. tenera TaxID=51953 RepID=A0A6J0PN41_ELAGV|nr:mRNA-decapping enzyme subunit 2 isoform X3 [Elaeis guineensis]